MKYKMILTALIVICLSWALSAQQEGTRKLNRQTKGDQQFIKLAESLELSPTQKKELFELFKAEKPARNDKKRGDRAARLTDEERATKEREINEKVAEILDEGQLEKYLAIKAERKEALEAKRKERTEHREKTKAYHEANIKPVMEAQRNKLEKLLSQDEIATVNAVRDKMMKEEGEKVENGRGRKARPSKEDAQTLQAIVVNHKEEIKTLLTEVKVQKEQWDADIKELRGEDNDKGRRKDKMKDRKDRNHRGKKHDKKKKQNGYDEDLKGAVRLLLGDF